MIRNFLILLFILIQLKAECYNSAFPIIDDLQEEGQVSDNQRDYELAKIYFKENKPSKALKKILPLLEESFEDRLLELKVYLLAGKILRETGDGSDRGVYHLETTGLFFKGNFKAINFVHKALKIVDEFKISDRGAYYGLSNTDLELLTAELYHLLSVCYLDTDKLDSSRVYSEKQFSINSVHSRIDVFKGRAYTNLGKVYFIEKKFEDAESMFKKSVEFHKLLKDDISVALAMNNLASIYLVKEEYPKAKKSYQEALTYLGDNKSSAALEHKEMIYDNLAWALYKLEDFKAYDYVTESYAIRDSLNEVGEQKKFAEIQAIHNVEMARQEEQIKTEKQERKTWIIGVTGIVVSLLLLYLANLYKLRQQSLSLKLSQSQLEQQRNLDRLKSQSQVKILNATIDGKETERKQIAEILHDNVSALLSSASMHLQASQQQFKGAEVPIELAKTQEIITEASHKIRDLSHNLMSSVLLKFGLEYAVKDSAKKFSNSNIRINTAIHNVYRYSQDQEIKIFNIIQELINNILKHSQAKNAYVIMEEEDDMLNIIVKDDGVGFKNKSEEEKGVGINQIKARIHMMNGSFLIESSQGMGTKTTMNIPVVRKKTRVYSA
ncbi:tetratricopeptide repeat protein [Tenacibaculum sp. 190524A05c]|uniref:tetratricopeptide repeat-containing sensor histidine kinase n=1 Tax=Tenacibaculum platacis TaxID=3137852 RepID=UPI0031FAB53E